MSHLTKKWRRWSRIIPVVFAIVGFVAINILFAITTFPILPWKTVETFILMVRYNRDEEDMLSDLLYHRHRR